jgi:hypothetical protein
MRTTLLILLSMSIAQTPDAASMDRAFECEKIKQKIEDIRSKMRAGYTRAQGERMEEALRRLRALRAKACR